MSRVPGLVLVQHMAATRERFMATEGREPTTLAIGRWDARELAQYLAATAEHQNTAIDWLRTCRLGVKAWNAEVKVDARVARMPGALWWSA